MSQNFDIGPSYIFIGKNGKIFIIVGPVLASLEPISTKKIINIVRCFITIYWDLCYLVH